MSGGFRKNPTARTVKRKTKGYRSGLGLTPGGGLKAAEDRAKTHAGGNAKVRVTMPQHRVKN